jgi:hypothetical protein
MSMTVWLNLRMDESYESDRQDLSALFALHEQLDEIASKLNASPISHYFDDTDVRYNMDEAGEIEVTEKGWPASSASWFDASVLLRTVTELRDFLDKNPNVVTEIDGWTQDDVCEDLLVLISGLEAAVKAKKPVHLLVVM